MPHLLMEGRVGHGTPMGLMGFPWAVGIPNESLHSVGKENVAKLMSIGQGGYHAHVRISPIATRTDWNY
jgi:hypothetical protein